MCCLDRWPQQGQARREEKRTIRVRKGTLKHIGTRAGSSRQTSGLSKALNDNSWVIIEIIISEIIYHDLSEELSSSIEFSWAGTNAPPYVEISP